MARKPSKVLTDLELEFMQIAWEQGACTTDSVRRHLWEKRPVADSTIRTMLGILAKKGYLRRRVDGRSYVYEPVVTKEEATRGMIKNLMDRLFQGSPEILVKSVLSSENIPPDELAAIKRLISQKEGKE